MLHSQLALDQDPQVTGPSASQIVQEQVNPLLLPALVNLFATHPLPVAQGCTQSADVQKHESLGSPWATTSMDPLTPRRIHHSAPALSGRGPSCACLDTLGRQATATGPLQVSATMARLNAHSMHWVLTPRACRDSNPILASPWHDHGENHECDIHLQCRITMRAKITNIAMLTLTSVFDLQHCQQSPQDS